jgi:hypothetical protein
VADYVDFQCKGPRAFLLPSLLPPRIRAHEAGIILAILLKPAANPLDMCYWSMTPYAFGDTACKFSTRPIGPATHLQNRFRPDTMRENMAARLADGQAEFDFCIQLRTDPARMPIEDPTIEWPEALSPFIPVARITIPPQNFDTPARRAYGDALSFTPWHTLPQHMPLGGINRARRRIYEAISTLRHTFNKQPSPEPPPTPNQRHIFRTAHGPTRLAALDPPPARAENNAKRLGTAHGQHPFLCRRVQKESF